MAKKDYYIWVEIEANKNRILDENYFSNIIDKCKDAGFDSIILAVKDTSGFGIYKSGIVPHYSLYDRDFKDEDYLKKYIKICHEKGMKIYAGIDVFAEGRIKNYHKLSPGFVHPEWQTCIHGIDHEGNSSIRPVGNLSGIASTGSIDDFSEVFVNPVREDVRNYELSIIEELVKKYDIDGIVLDRVRYVGIGSDFSDYTRDKFEEYLGRSVENWPEDIYKLKQNDKDIALKYGPLFGSWLTFRAGIIKKFIIDAGSVIKSCPGKVEFLDYTGSWYPLYYLVGSNWGSEKYIPEEYPWVGSEYGSTGYAEYIDKLLSGFYYPDVTIEDALRNRKPAYWYSVEGSGDIVGKVVNNAVPYAGSLFVKQYEDNPQSFREAIKMCFKKSSGCMIFDLSYIDDYNWWDLCRC